jgi:hypothetical protein
VCLAYAASDTPQNRGAILSPLAEIQQLQARIAAAKATGQTPDPAWTARIDELLPLTGAEATTVPVNPQSLRTDPLFTTRTTMPSERPSTPLEQQIRALEDQLYSTSGAMPVISSSLKDQLNALYSQRPENRIHSAQTPQRPNTALERQIRTLEEQLNREGAAASTTIKQQLNTLYEQRPENRPRRNPLDQGGDNCSSVTVIVGLPFYDSGTTAGYTDDFQPSCGTAAGAPDLIYQFTAIHSGPHDFSLNGSSFDTEIYVRTGGACPGTTEVGCNDDYFGLQSYLNLNLVAGQTYWVIVDGFYNYSGSYSLAIRDLVGDNCSSAINVPGVPYTDYGNTSGLTDDFQPTCGYANGAPDVVYTLTPLYTGSYTISLCGSSFDTELYVRTGGACPGTTVLSCNDDACGLQSSLVLNLTAGTTYYIIVDGYNANAGAYVLNITDDCSEACQAGDLLEAAETPSPTFGATDPDGGCNNTGDWNNPPNLFGYVFPWQVYCGSAFTYVSPTNAGFRDTDWYRFTLSEACSLQVNALSEFPITSYIFAANCPAGAILAQGSAIPCSFMSYSTGTCLPAGDYYLWFGPSVYSGLATPRAYRFALLTYPCSGCYTDGTYMAPVSITGNTCGAVNNCSLRPSEDQNWRINIPREADWTFSMCGTSPNWDSYIYLTSSCCNGIIAQDDDGCGGVGVSTIHCVHLLPGTYYLNVEAYSSACGSYTLNITECTGKCCYGTLLDPQCQDGITNAACQALSGVYTEDATCGTTACYLRPNCVEGSQFSQRPFVPTEGWGGYASDVATQFANYEDFSGVANPIGEIRFWGFRANFNSGNAPCGEDPMPFHIRFYQNNAGNVGALVATYNVTLNGTMGYTYGSTYPLFEYSATLYPAVNLASGWVSITGDGDPNCSFFWATANSGDGTAWQYVNNVPAAIPLDFAMCLGVGCPTATSVTADLFTDGVSMRVVFNAPQLGLYTIWGTTSHTASFPSTFVPLASGSVGAIGSYYWLDGTSAPYKRYAITRQCGELPPGLLNQPSPFHSVSMDVEHAAQ